jgi:DNA repair photolyase
MFPTTHDIVPETLDFCLEVLGNLLAAGNNVLVVSKPHLVCVRALCGRFAALATPNPNDSNLRLRFTIGSDNDEVLHFWEPGAPSFQERLECLQLAHSRGFSTSISMEPLLDPANAVALVRRLLPFVTDALWLGLMNRAAERCVFETPEQATRLRDLLAAYKSPVLEEIREALKSEPKVRWKYEMRRRLGL